MALVIDQGRDVRGSADRLYNSRNAGWNKGVGPSKLEKYLREKERREEAQRKEDVSRRQAPHTRQEMQQAEEQRLQRRQAELERRRQELRNQGADRHGVLGGRNAYQKTEREIERIKARQVAVRQSMASADDKERIRMENRARVVSDLSRNAGSTSTPGGKATNDFRGASQRISPRVEEGSGLGRIPGAEDLTYEDMLARVPELQNTLLAWRDRPEGNDYVADLPQWITEEHVQMLMESGVIPMQVNEGAVAGNIAGTALQGGLRASQVVGEGEESDYLGVAENWADNFATIRFDDETGLYSIVEAQYRVGAARGELAQMTRTEIDNFREAALVINNYAYLRGGALVDGAFGVGKELTDADVAMMQYLMGWANENGTSWDQAGSALVQQAFKDEEAGLYGADDGGGSGASGEVNPVLKTVDTYFTLSDLDFSRNSLKVLMAEKMGREPTDSEVRQYLSTLNAAERKKPQTVTTNYTYNEDNKRTASNVVTEQPEIDRGALAEPMADTQEARDFQEGRAMETILQLAGW